MPNWCENYLIVHFNPNNQRELMYARRLKTAYEKSKLLNALVKRPKHQPDINKPNPFFAKGGLGVDEQKLFGRNNWYDWSVDNWGTKWEVSSSDGSVELEENGTLSIRFMSAWSPPTPAISKIKLPFELYFWEPGVGFMGQLLKDNKESEPYENSMSISIPDTAKTEEDVYKHLRKDCENNNINPDIVDYMGMSISYVREEE